MFKENIVCENLGRASKFLKKILGGGGNQYKSIAQKILALGVMFSLVTSTATATIIEQVELEVELAANSDIYEYGDVATFTVVITNNPPAGDDEGAVDELTGDDGGAVVELTADDKLIISVNGTDYPIYFSNPVQADQVFESVVGPSDFDLAEGGSCTVVLKCKISDLGLGLGTHEITAKLELSDNKADRFKVTPATETVRVVEKKLTPSVSLTADKIFDGTVDIDPDLVEVEFKDSAGATVELTRDTDYTISDAKFEDASVGDYKPFSATVTLLGDAVTKYHLSSEDVSGDGAVTERASGLWLNAPDGETGPLDNLSYGDPVVVRVMLFDGYHKGGYGTPINKDWLRDGDKVQVQVLSTATDFSRAFKVTDASFDVALSDFVPVVGEYTVDVLFSASAESGYLNAHNETNFTVHPRQVNVRADDATKVAGTEEPVFSYHVDDDTPLVGDDSLVGELKRVPGETVGTYAITQGTLTNENNPNYDINFTPGTFTITAAASESPVVLPSSPDDYSGFFSPDADKAPSLPDKSGWGDVHYYNDIKHYVNAEGQTSVEITGNELVWLKEESNGSTAWYGLDNSSGIFESGSRFYVQWLNYKDHPEEFADIDDSILQIIEGDNGWLFKVGVIKPDGTRYEQLPQEVELYVQIGDDWDKDDLRAFYITQNNDESVEVDFVNNLNFPAGVDTFAVMKLNHFSPYLILDEVDVSSESSEISLTTGDQTTYFTISSLGLIMTLALGLMLKTKFGGRKFDK